MPIASIRSSLVSYVVLYSENIFILHFTFRNIMTAIIVYNLNNENSKKRIFEL